MTIQHAETDQDIQRCYQVMSELRPHIAENEFLTRIRLQQQEGYRLLFLEHRLDIVAVAGYRVTTNLFKGKMLYVDDLVTAASQRSAGHGAVLLDALKKIALDDGCVSLQLDSGTQRTRAHRFYFREGLVCSAFHFEQPLN